MWISKKEYKKIDTLQEKIVELEQRYKATLKSINEIKQDQYKMDAVIKFMDTYPEKYRCGIYTDYRNNKLYFEFSWVYRGILRNSLLCHLESKSQLIKYEVKKQDSNKVYDIFITLKNNNDDDNYTELWYKVSEEYSHDILVSKKEISSKEFENKNKKD